MNIPVFASDWSGVINDNHFVKDGSESSILNPNPDAEGYLTIQPVRDALASLQVIQGKGYEIHIVSRIDPGERIEFRVRRWLRHHGFEAIVPQSQVHFCEQWHEKATVCRAIRPRFFVDDRLEVLQHLVGLVPYLFVFRPRFDDKQERPLVHLITSGKVVRADNWWWLASVISRP